ncbi:GNAT family N-acetyltransferase [Rubeoparvulum massiliense]|uniref:GNAT family N-acetyltransferase n=1 Tax=Rubeoparvulum massiliense TaxID=1631346 RepID=UPI00164EAAB5|nr:GNAT family N-acetyltransferase [Rubeoparvulum massiliense]
MERIMQIAAETPDECWAESQFLMELPGKWKYSLALLHRGQVIGYLLASDKEVLNSIHIHKLIVDYQFRSLRLGEKLMQTFCQKVMEAQIPKITLKVAQINSGAIRFYIRMKFQHIGEEGAWFWMAREMGDQRRK